MMNILNGGSHADNNVDFQEFMIIPATSKTFEESLKMATDIYSSLRKNIETNNLLQQLFHYEDEYLKHNKSDFVFGVYKKKLV